MRIIILALLALAAPAAARDLPVPANKGWQHAQTGLILMPMLDGLPRTKLIDLTQTEHDVAAEFATSDQSTVVTVYLFHPAVDSVAMWFERSEAAIFNRAVYGEVAPASANPIPFAPPASSTPRALRRVYAPGKGPYRSTGLAIMPLGEWFVAIRISSTQDSTAALDTRLSRVIAALRWPAGIAPAPAVATIPDCAKPLAFDRKAKRVKSQGADVLLALIGATAAKEAEDKTGKSPEPASWCRDPSGTPGYGVYRGGDEDKGYTVALQDAGRAITVAPSLVAAVMGSGARFQMTLTDVDGTVTTFPGFDRLPAPDQAVSALDGPRLGTTDGKQITLGKDAL